MTPVETVTVIAALVGILGQLAITLRLAFYVGELRGEVKEKLGSHGERITKLEGFREDHGRLLSEHGERLGKLEAVAPRRITDR